MSRNPDPLGTILRMKARAVDYTVRATTGPLKGWRRRLKRGTRLRDRWIGLYFRHMGIDPHAPAKFKPTQEFIQQMQDFVRSEATITEASQGNGTTP